MSRPAHLAYSVGTGISLCGRQSDCDFIVEVRIMQAQNAWSLCSSCSQDSPCAKIFQIKGDAKRPDTISLRERERERDGAVDVLRDQEHNGGAKGKGIGLSPIGGAINLNWYAHDQGIVLNQAAAYAERRKVVKAQLNCKTFSLSSFGEYCIR